MGVQLTDADHERLRYAYGGRDPNPTSSLFGPGSMTWHVNREAVLLLGGGRALLMQVAHPLVAAGVQAFSDFRRDPLRRLQRTLDLTLTMTFAGAAHAIEAVRTIEAVHQRVHGQLEDDIGPFPRGTFYDANDPELLFWVHATLVDTALMAYDRYVGPLPAGDRARYYQESTIAARLMGIPQHLIPAEYADFKRYMSALLRGPQLVVGRAAREIAASILRPPLPRVTQPAFWLSAALTRELLPPVLRQRYGFGPQRTSALVEQSVAWMTRPTLPLLPRLIRLMPHARHAGAGK
jgi:uncharacterized protein (DUF2236 family)